MTGCGRSPGRLSTHLTPDDEPADLVLPAAAGREHLLHLQHLPDQLVEHDRPAEEPREAGEDHAAEDRGRAEPGALRHRAQQRDLEARPEPVEHLRQRPGPGGGAVEAHQAQGRLREREGGDGVPVVAQLLEARERLGVAEVDRVDPHVPLGRAAAEDLDRRLAVEVHREVHDPPALAQGVGRGVGPAAGEVEPHRARAPRRSGPP